MGKKKLQWKRKLQLKKNYRCMEKSIRFSPNVSILNFKQGNVEKGGLSASVEAKRGKK